MDARLRAPVLRVWGLDVGLGDWIMATADVKTLHEKNGRPVVVLGLGGRQVWNEIFDNNPRITKSRQVGQPLMNGPGCRPYIVSKTSLRWTWRRNRNQQPGEIYLTPAEKEFAEPYRGKVLIEPNIKKNGHANKAWPFERWQAVVDELKVPMVQVGGEGTRWLRRVEKCHTPTFRHACGVLGNSKAFVGTEGALHHAAAALDIPAVVLFSEFIAPDVTGYSSQKNIRHAGEPCGSRVPCPTCAASMLSIGVDEVSDALARALQ